MLDAGPYGSWDERGVADPYAFRAGDEVYLFYIGMDRARQHDSTRPRLEEVKHVGVV